MNDQPRRLPKGGEAQCVGCGAFFTSDSGFDAHLRPLAQGGCSDPATLINRRGQPMFEAVERLGGTTWRQIRYDREGNRCQNPLSGRAGRPSGDSGVEVGQRGEEAA